MLPGVIGVIQANEALKILVGYGDPLVGRLLMFDAQPTTFRELKLRRDPTCATCGKDAPAWLAYEGAAGLLEAPPPSPGSNGAVAETAPATSNGSANGEAAPAGAAAGAAAPSA